MSGRSRSPLFLERASYRQRRLRDAVRLIPIFGAILWAIPLLWSRDTSNAAVVLYVFGVWVLLIIASALTSRRLNDADAATSDAHD